MPEKDYSHRTNVQKLGVKPDERLEVSGDVGPGLRSELKEALGRGLVRSGDLDGAIVMVARSRRARRRWSATAPA